jgi:KaiC/GvpD/RAD55 family RecA-like ATPase
MCSKGVEVLLSDYASVEASLPEVEWLWEGWLPRGFVTVLASAPGEGKSALALEIIRRILLSCRGGPMCPPGSAVSSIVGEQSNSEEGAPLADARGKHMGGPLQEKATAILIDTEATEAILRKRVREWKVPTEGLRVFASKDPVSAIASLSLDDAEEWSLIERSVKAEKPALVVVDSLSGAHSGSENSSQLRGLLLKLARLARDSSAAVLVVHHLRKRHALEPDAVTLDRIRGSGVIAQLARCIWALDRPDPRDARRRLAQIKNNLAPFPAALGVAIDATGVTFSDAAPQRRGRGQTAQAAEFLTTLLAEGSVPMRDAAAAMHEAGFNDFNIRSAAADVGVVRTRKSYGGSWRWSLPRQDDSASHRGQVT